MTLSEFLAAELYFEPAAAAVLQRHGFKVHSPWVRADPTSGQPIEVIPDDACVVTFTLEGATDDRFFADNPEGAERSMDLGFTGILEIEHRVPAASPTDLTAAQPGEIWPRPYTRLCAQRGRIRAAFLEDADPFGPALSAIDILSIKLIAPEKGQERMIAQATERFRIRFAPAAGALTTTTPA